MCGLFGVINYRNVKPAIVSNAVRALGKESEVRGKDAGGIAYYKDGDLKISKNKNAVSLNGSLVKEAYTSPIVMGHTRMTTQGSAHFNFNNHPFQSVVSKYSMAHNGVFYNDDFLAKEFDLSKSKIQTDSYVVVKYLDTIHKGVINFDTLKDVAEKLSGSFTLTFLDEEESLWIVRGSSPLTIMDIKELGIIMYASTDGIMYDALGDMFEVDLYDYLLARKGKRSEFGVRIPIAEGEIIRIKKDGSIQRGKFDKNKSVFYGSYHKSWDYSGWSDDDMGECVRYWDMTKDTKKETAYLPSNVNQDKGVESAFDSLTRGINRMLVFYNGTEFEVSYPAQSAYRASDINRIWSMFKGTYVDIKNPSLNLLISKERMLKPVVRGDLAPLTKIYYPENGTYVKSVALMNMLEAELNSNTMLSEAKTLFPPIKALLDMWQGRELLMCYAYMIWYDYCYEGYADAMTSEIMSELPFSFALEEAVKKLKEFKTTYNLYLYLQGMTVHMITMVDPTLLKVDMASPF